MTYELINWKDFPNEETPLSSFNLNHMDTQIKRNADDIELLKKDVNIPATTERAGIVKPDGTTITVDEDGTIHSDIPNNVTLFEAGDTNQLIDKNGNGLLPITNTKAVFDDAGNRLDNTINGISQGIISSAMSNGNLTNIFTVDSTSDGFNNQPHTYHEAVTSDLPNGARYGIRTVYFYNSRTMIIELHDISSGTIFINKMSGGNWGSWQIVPVNSTISDAYNPSKTYAQGEFCIYNNTLWKSKVNNNTGNTPTGGSYWTATSICNELIALWNK